jgi:hypothetical protein
MKWPRRIRCAAALIAMLATVCWTGQLSAQVTPDTTAGGNGQSNQPNTAANTPDSATSTTTDQAQLTQYAPALDGAGLISMNFVQKIHLLTGGTVSGGYDSNPDNLSQATSTTLYSFSPYIGVQASTDRTQYLLQYHPLISRYSSYASQTMNVASVRIVRNMSPRWNWTLGLMGSHGDDSLRLLGPIQSVVVGNVPGAGPNSASYLPNAGTVTDLNGGLDFRYDASERDAFSIQIADSFNSLPALHERGSVATSNVNYTRSLKSALSILTYSQTSRYYGDLNCTAVGGGFGVKWQPQLDTILSLKGGPQFNSPGCKTQQGFSYSASLAKKLRISSQFYILGDRVPVTSYLGSGLWQDDVSGGYQRQILRTNIAAFDVGYVHSSTLLNASSYHGTFINPSYTHMLHRGMTLGCSYRTYMGSLGGTNFSRNMLLFSLTLTPNTRALFQ